MEEDKKPLSSLLTKEFILNKQLDENIELDAIDNVYMSKIKNSIHENLSLDSIKQWLKDSIDYYESKKDSAMEDLWELNSKQSFSNEQENTYTQKQTLEKQIKTYGHMLKKLNSSRIKFDLFHSNVNNIIKLLQLGSFNNELLDRDDWFKNNNLLSKMFFYRYQQNEVDAHKDGHNNILDMYTLFDDIYSNSNVKDELVQWLVGMLVLLEAEDEIALKLKDARKKMELNQFLEKDYVGFRKRNLTKTYNDIYNKIPSSMYENDKEFFKDTLILLDGLYQKGANILSDNDVIEIIILNKDILPFKPLYNRELSKEYIEKMFDYNIKNLLTETAEITLVIEQIKDNIDLLQPNIIATGAKKQAGLATKLTALKNSIDELSKAIEGRQDDNSNLIITNDPRLSNFKVASINSFDIPEDRNVSLGVLIRQNKVWLERIKERGYLRYSIRDLKNDSILIYNDKASSYQWLNKNNIFFSNATIESNDSLKQIINNKEKDFSKEIVFVEEDEILEEM